MKINYSAIFIKKYKKLPKNIKILAEKKEIIFKINPFEKGLKTHKLSGKLSNFWSFSINYKYRIIFEFIKKDEINFLFIGKHDIYNI
ncbi:type II toxin-antitoxin system mRNA interferase toxin, RelE/StbE family [Patescibacteria group bacterium]|nr:type II toxin-antitoxin system mRNA interferase toxin, RelE/StbE family [Patescibacteria group bacterium]